MWQTRRRPRIRARPRCWNIAGCGARSIAPPEFPRHWRSNTNSQSEVVESSVGPLIPAFSPVGEKVPEGRLRGCPAKPPIITAKWYYKAAMAFEKLWPETGRAAVSILTLPKFGRSSFGKAGIRLSLG